MEEAKYRGSRLCRLMGNPVVYQLVLLLGENGPLTPSKLAKFAGRSVQTVSEHLGKLRAADIVRYDSKGKEVHYWLKHKGEDPGSVESGRGSGPGGQQAALKYSFRRFGNSRNVEVSVEIWKRPVL